MFPSGAPEVSDDTLQNSQGRYPGGSLEAAYQITGKHSMLLLCMWVESTELQASALSSNSIIISSGSFIMFSSCWQTIIIMYVNKMLYYIEAAFNAV